MAYITHDGPIIDRAGKVIFLSAQRFVDDICLGNCCFICGAKPEDKPFNNEHILPVTLLAVGKMAEYLDLADRLWFFGPVWPDQVRVPAKPGPLPRPGPSAAEAPRPSRPTSRPHGEVSMPESRKTDIYSRHCRRERANLTIDTRAGRRS
jgi:hypothetical protein